MKRPRLQIIIYMLIAYAVTSCSSIKFYNSHHDEVGLKYFYPKPYILVQHNVSKDTPVKISLIYLPNLQDSQFVKVRNGIGTNQIEIDITNGILTKISSTADSKTPETITALGSLATALASFIKPTSASPTPSSASASPTPATAVTAPPPFELYEVVFDGTCTKLYKVNPGTCPISK